MAQVLPSNGPTWIINNKPHRTGIGKGKKKKVFSSWSRLNYQVLTFFNITHCVHTQMRVRMWRLPTEVVISHLWPLMVHWFCLAESGATPTQRLFGWIFIKLQFKAPFKWGLWYSPVWSQSFSQISHIIRSKQMLSAGSHSWHVLIMAQNAKPFGQKLC